MGLARRAAIGVGGLLGVLVVGAGAFYLWASSAASSRLAVSYAVHRVDFPIPFPLTEAELSMLRAERGVLAESDIHALATARAVARGQHLIESFYACAECHGADFGGGVMIDDRAVGRILGPNLTLGSGSRTLAYTAADWDRMVRHGVKPSGSGSPMPSKDFFEMSDRELSDVVSYIRSRPAVNREVPAVTLGPLGKVLLATGELLLSADIHPTKHIIDHAVLPPPVAADATFGRHRAQTCTGCHRDNFAGGPIIGGPPDWPPAANLTPAGLVGWTYDDFVGALRDGKSKNGRALLEPMSSMPKFAKNMTEVEMQALWEFIRALPAAPTGR